MNATTHPDCPIGRQEHERHYIGRDARGIPQRCEGYAEEDGAFDGSWWRETGWTGL